MTRTFRRTQLLTVLALLLSGLLQPLVAGGANCSRTHAPAQQAQPSFEEAVDAPIYASDAEEVVSGQHRHESVPPPDPMVAGSGSCGVAAIPSEHPLELPFPVAIRIILAGDVLPASLSAGSLFRPPRLS